jgi:hypothetical protein
MASSTPPREMASSTPPRENLLTLPRGDGRVSFMGSILIRQVPDPIHKGFKKLCQMKQTSMERELVRLMSREVEKASRKK